MVIMKNSNERVYLIKYKLYDACGGSFKYALNPRYEERREYFSRLERDKFISRYVYLKNKDEMYIGDVECYFAELKLILDNEMETLIERI
jgi:hypothetical protein